MRTIPLIGRVAAGRVAIVDDDDFALVSKYRWYANESVRPTGALDGPYALASIQLNGRWAKLKMHKLITGWPRTDHINHDGLDNRRVNLRPATNAQNNHNERPHMGSSSQYKGVTWHRQVNKWQATIKIDGKSHYLGCFISEEDAARAYNTAAQDAYGAYAYLNPLPNEGRAA